MKKNSDIQTTLNFLYSLHSFGIKLGLKNIRKLLSTLDNPHKKIITIHVAGTNGKGSTCSMIAAILTAAGYKVGLYTSPHLVRFNERIRINGKMISDAEIVRYAKIIRSEVVKQHATFFETTTAIAFKYFFDTNVDIAVIETGLGGRLDSTNVIRPIASVITTIGKDHVKHLGNTIGKIAFEKAGIIKYKIPVVAGNISGTAKKVIWEIAKKKKSKIYFSQKEILDNSLKNFAVELQGKHQTDNTKTALSVIHAISNKFSVSDEAIFNGLANTTALSGLRGRFEFLRRGTKRIILDVAHNADGIEVLVQSLKAVSSKKIVVIFGVMKDKNYRTMLEKLQKISPKIIATQPNIERALRPEQIGNLCAEMEIEYIVTKNVNDAVRVGIISIGKEDILVITGSFYVAGEAVSFLENS